MAMLVVRRKQREAEVKLQAITSEADAGADVGFMSRWAVQQRNGVRVVLQPWMIPTLFAPWRQLCWRNNSAMWSCAQ